MFGACHVGESLIDGNPLYERREIAHHLEGGVAQSLIFIEMAADENELWTELARSPSRHSATHAEDFGFVRGGKHHAAADSDGLAPQRRIEQLLDRRIKGVQVRMQDGGQSFQGENTCSCSKRVGA